MDRNSVEASNGRVRYVGRDFDLYFFKDQEGTLQDEVPGLSQRNESSLKMVASTNCSFNSTATYDTIIDKSTPKSGIKQLNSIDWSFSSDNNIANLEDIQALMEAHKAGSKIYVILGVSTPREVADVDREGSYVNVDDTTTEEGVNSLVSGFCVIQSITLNAQDGSLATFSMTLEGSGDFSV